MKYTDIDPLMNNDKNRESFFKRNPLLILLLKIGAYTSPVWLCLILISTEPKGIPDLDSIITRTTLISNSSEFETDLINNHPGQVIDEAKFAAKQAQDNSSNFNNLSFYPDTINKYLAVEAACTDQAQERACIVTLRKWKVNFDLQLQKDRKEVIKEKYHIVLK